jgi:hypothetical protein
MKSEYSVLSALSTRQTAQLVSSWGFAATSITAVGTRYRSDFLLLSNTRRQYYESPDNERTKRYHEMTCIREHTVSADAGGGIIYQKRSVEGAGGGRS